MVRVAASRDAFTKTQICPHLQLPGGCRRGTSCNFAHSQIEVRSKPDLRKTRLCDKYMQTGSCDRGITCEFAHGEKELRSTDGYFKTDFCKYWKAGKCHAGPSCRHAHGYQDLRARKFKMEEIDALQRGAPMSEICMLRAQDLLQAGIDPNTDPFLRERAERDADILETPSLSTPPPTTRKIPPSEARTATTAATGLPGGANANNNRMLAAPPNTTTVASNISSVASQQPSLLGAHASNNYSGVSTLSPSVAHLQQSSSLSRPTSHHPHGSNISRPPSGIRSDQHFTQQQQNNPSQDFYNLHGTLALPAQPATISHNQPTSPFSSRFSYLLAPPPAFDSATPHGVASPPHPLAFQHPHHNSTSSLSAVLDAPSSPFAAAMREALLLSPSAAAGGFGFTSGWSPHQGATGGDSPHHNSLLVALARVVANTPRAGMNHLSLSPSSIDSSPDTLPPGILPTVVNPSANASYAAAWPPGYTPLNSGNSPTAALVQAVTSFQIHQAFQQKAAAAASANNQTAPTVNVVSSTTNSSGGNLTQTAVVAPPSTKEETA